MLNSSKLVSFCIPAYNAERTIKATLASICAQTYLEIEIIVIDDGSYDNTFLCAKGIEDPRVFSYRINNSGAAAARNEAYKRSNGEFIIFFDADDIIPVDFLANQIHKLDGRKKSLVMSGWGRFYDDSLETFSENFIPSGTLTFVEWIEQYWMDCNPMTNPGRALLPRDLVEEAGLWDETLSLNDDLEFFTRVFAKCDSIILNPSSKLYYRSGHYGISAQKNGSAYQSLATSVIMATRLAVKIFPNNKMVKAASANMLKSCVYEIYPSSQSLVATLEKEISKLVPPTVKFQSSGVTGILKLLLGWKLTKKLKLALAKGRYA
ncbi:glycosyltransferase family 2 protein [Pedobacter sandarakinus]|uniref:glycosyltransferase family 2 protein n=1 Tax=Pedobacter sandarakinus TaxID=353156 RepID=UPI0022477402|nr:glycosyltransferase family A protein [Pedobacter sandarakinus]MCX2575915.1 glycosyltransferase family A protein [Pedobacter sandarakinus]